MKITFAGPTHGWDFKPIKPEPTKETQTMKGTKYPVPTLPCLRVDEDGDVFLFTKWTNGSNSPLVYSKHCPAKVGTIYTSVNILENPHEMEPYTGEVVLSFKPELKMDDPIWVGDDGLEWHARHFSGWGEEGRVTTWVNGRTSHSAKTAEPAWLYYSLTNPSR